MTTPAGNLAIYADLLNGDQIWYTSKEAAAVLGLTPQSVRNAFESQAIMGHEVRATRANEKRRCIKMIHRDCLLIYMMETANFSHDDMLRRIHALLSNRTTDQLEKIGKWIDKQVAVRKGEKVLG